MNNQLIANLQSQVARLTTRLDVLNRIVLQIRPHLFPDEEAATSDDSTGFFPVLVRMVSGEDGTDDTIGTYKYNVYDLAGALLASSLAPKRRREKGHIDVPPDDTVGSAYHDLNNQVQLYDANEIYDTFVCSEGE
jgi:hypothetical protein